jgi:hypothetical protein
MSHVFFTSSSLTLLMSEERDLALSDLKTIPPFGVFSGREKMRLTNETLCRELIQTSL